MKAQLHINHPSHVLLDAHLNRKHTSYVQLLGD
jgi:hypothetical protein